MDFKNVLKNIETEHLVMIPVTLDITRSLLIDQHDVLEKYGLVSHAMWPTSDTKDILPIINRVLEESLEPSGFEFWMVVKKDKMMIIGDIGFHAKPDSEGVVEIGFGFVEHERGKGYGSEALFGIMDWLSHQESVKVIKADCLIDNKASVRLLEKIGMKEVYRNETYIFWEMSL